MHLRCPHCRNAVEIVDVPSGGEITCPGCGSSFQVAGLSTVTWDGPTKKRIGKFEILRTVVVIALVAVSSLLFLVGR